MYILTESSQASSKITLALLTGMQYYIWVAAATWAAYTHFVATAFTEGHILIFYKEGPVTN